MIKVKVSVFIPPSFFCRHLKDCLEPFTCCKNMLFNVAVVAAVTASAVRVNWLKRPLCVCHFVLVILFFSFSSSTIMKMLSVTHQWADSETKNACPNRTSATGCGTPDELRWWWGSGVRGWSQRVKVYWQTLGDGMQRERKSNSADSLTTNPFPTPARYWEPQCWGMRELEREELSGLVDERGVRGQRSAGWEQLNEKPQPPFYQPLTPSQVQIHC